ncbi:MAG: TIGR04076 family protein [Chloroflexi bacterium]|nr:TIGR04076 family protein [Chloroflexota bacterium]
MTQRQPLAIGHRVECAITEIKGNCSWGHQVGDKFEVSTHDTAGMCGFFYHDVFPRIMMLQFGGGFPWGDADVSRVECPDRQNCVKAELRRIPRAT